MHIFKKYTFELITFFNLGFDTFSLFSSAFVKKMVLISNILCHYFKYQWAESQHFSWEDLRYPKKQWFFQVCIYWLRFDIWKSSNKLQKLYIIFCPMFSYFLFFLSIFSTHFTSKCNTFIFHVKIHLDWVGIAESIQKFSGKKNICKKAN